MVENLHLMLRQKVKIFEPGLGTLFLQVKMFDLIEMKNNK